MALERVQLSHIKPPAGVEWSEEMSQKRGQKMVPGKITPAVTSCWAGKRETAEDSGMGNGSPASELKHSFIHLGWKAPLPGILLLLMPAAGLKLLIAAIVPSPGQITWEGEIHDGSPSRFPFT